MRGSYRSDLTGMFREASAALREVRLSGAPLDEVTQMRAERGHARRQILTGVMATAAAVMLPRKSLAIGQPRVVIVGAGAAGLTCAYELWTKRGIAAKLYEWNTRAGGRIQTLRNYFANGQITEQHAEFISTEHVKTMQYAHDFGLSFEDAWATRQGAKDDYWFSGEPYTQKALNKDWQDFGWQLFRDAVRKAPGASYKHYSQDAYAWDHMSVSEWIDRHVPGGRSSRFGKLCLSDVIDEFGCHPEEQSALNLVYILGYDASSNSGYQQKDSPLLAGSDEHWHIKGGNDQLTDGLAARLPRGALHLSHRLIALSENSDGSFTCTFSHHGSTVESVADHVVLALPFTTLREVNLSSVTLSPLKRKAIQSLPLGTNAKIQIQVAGRPWTKDGFDGSILTGPGLDGGWDATSYQDGGNNIGTEIFLAFPGGVDGIALASKYGLKFGREQGPASSLMVNDTLAQLEPIFHGVTSAWKRGPKLAWFNDGNIDEHLRGAWSQYNIGQYTGFSGIEALREGNIHFAGEQTDPNFQGYIEGAVRSGLRVEQEI
jgi:monoamine oxidase